MTTQNINYSIGTYDNGVDGKEWVSVSVFLGDSDAQAEAQVRNIGPQGASVPTNDDGEPLDGLYIRRAGVEWFCRF